MSALPKNVLLIFDRGHEEPFWFFYFSNVSADTFKRLSRLHNHYIGEKDLRSEVEQDIYDFTLFDPDASSHRQSEIFDDYPAFRGSSTTFVQIKMDGETTILQTGILP